ncbi:2-hydroxyglutaryl-CoA dehydratase [Desulfosarcina ovata subsp. sediminis]|uniref:2-hydroxyglutaryl-CoA dehydratase n=1 Tax=Desulfosarcina ovata subsp. sediminis TaxID=885957 RepID=A0A5K7ZLT4_9BACT|nr:acyl-CoA dehydratase activase [Desulfosarcina ovata]BBO81007.1 2-hydroxyglutaryl-CoA dehydratase [Desulfosarcina ovata subsp. sediminis]
MITAGIDVGAKNVKIVLFEDGEVVARGTGLMEMDREQSIQIAYQATLKDNDIQEQAVERVVATGAGAKSVVFATDRSTLVTCISRGVRAANPSIRTIIDIGANDAMAIKCDETGKVVDFAVNEKCAAGAGSFVEAMARAMEVSLEEFVAFSLASTKSIPINAQCVIFAESEVVSLIHEDTDRNDICRAVHDAMAGRIASMARRVRIEPPVAVTGGASYNQGMLDSLTKELDIALTRTDNAEYVAAHGAALLAAEGRGSA